MFTQDGPNVGRKPKESRFDQKGSLFECCTILSIIADWPNIQQSRSNDIIELQPIPKHTPRLFLSLSSDRSEEWTDQSITIKVILSHIEGN